jgi:plasmid replication initiation protein
MSNPVLLPERHPIKDFFIADIFDAIPVKNDRHTMEHPFFTLSTQKDIRAIEYQHGDVSITLSPSSKYGLPTMMDKDILLYCGSLVVAELNKGNLPPRTVRFSAHDLLVTTNRDTSGKAYELLKSAFERLAGCLVTTSIATNGKRQAQGFHLMESYKILETSRDKRRMVRLEVTLSEWFYNSLVGREVLTINRDYFRLRKTLERRLYELARKHCGNQTEWHIKLETLHEKSGSQSPIRKFRFQLRGIIADNEKESHFPDYRISLADNDVVTFHNRKSLKSLEKPSVDRRQLAELRGATVAKARQMAESRGLDFDVIVSEFAAHMENKGNPDNINGAFIGFVKKKVANRS